MTGSQLFRLNDELQAPAAELGLHLFRLMTHYHYRPRWLERRCHI